MKIFHLALPEQWAAAVEAGEYRVSTRGATLEQVGFIHCSRPEQVQGVHGRFYADLTDLLLLTIDTDRLISPWQLDEVAGAEQTFPHVYGPLNLDAVVDAGAWNGSGSVCKDRRHDSEA